MYFSSRPRQKSEFEYAADDESAGDPAEIDARLEMDARLEASAVTIQRRWRGSRSRMEASVRRDVMMWKSMGTFISMPESSFPPEVTRFRMKLYYLLEDPSSSTAAQILAACILSVIFLSIACLVLETMPELKDERSEYAVSSATWDKIETFTTILFTIEFLLRLFVCNVFKPLKVFLSSPMTTFDFLAVAPFYIELLYFKLKPMDEGSDLHIAFLRVLRATRLTRLFRIFKLGRYSSGLHIMGSALMDSLNVLYVLVFFLGIGVVLFSSVMYYAEKLICPPFPGVDDIAGMVKWNAYQETCLQLAMEDKFELPNGEICCTASGKENVVATYVFPDIIQTFWWAIVTMTTCGYGDKIPQTVAGMLIGSVCMLCGILLIALPVAIVGRNFQDAYEKMEEETALDRSKTATSIEFKAKMDTFPKPLRPPLSGMSGRFEEMGASMTPSCLGAASGTTMKEIAALLTHTQTLNETLYKLQCAELLRQDEIFDSVEELLRYVQRKNGGRNRQK